MAVAGSVADRRFVLAYSKGGGTLLPSVEKLIRNANEAAGDPQRFADLLSLENIAEAPQLLKHVGKDPHQVLRRAALDFVPEGVLAEDTQMRARLLAGEADAGRLV